MNRIHFSVLVLLCTFTSINAQQHPDREEQNNLLKTFSFSTDEGQQVKIADFKGKWLIIYAWSVGCVSCFESFPKINMLQEEFRSNIHFLLVGQEHPLARSIYNRYQAKKGLQLKNTYSSDFFKVFDIKAVPHVIIVNPAGLIFTYAHHDELTSHSLASLLNTGKYAFSNKRVADTLPSAPLVPFANEGLQRNSPGFIVQSILKEWNPSEGIWTPDFSTRTNWRQLNPRGIQISGANLDILFTTAFLGQNNIPYEDSLYLRYWRKPILDIDDSSLFAFDGRTGKNVFSYSLLVSDSLATGFSGPVNDAAGSPENISLHRNY